MWKPKSYHILFMIAALCSLLAVHGAAQAGGGPLTPYQKAILDLYYRQLAQQISGTNITAGTLPIEALGFTVITNETDPIFVVFFVGAWPNHTNNPAAHHPVFTAADEADPIFTNYLATAAPPVTVEVDPIFTNLFGVSGVFTQSIGAHTTEWWITSGVITQIMTNSTLVLP